MGSPGAGIGSPPLDPSVVDVNVSVTPLMLSVVLTDAELLADEVWRTVIWSPSRTETGPAPHDPAFFLIWLDAAPLIAADRMTPELMPVIVSVFDVRTVLTGTPPSSSKLKASGVVSGRPFGNRRGLEAVAPPRFL